MSIQFDQDRIKKRINESLEKIYTVADPALLNQYRSLVKKEVSFFKRSYLTAWLLMELDQKGGGREGGHRRGNQQYQPFRREASSEGRRYGTGAAAQEDEGARNGEQRFPLAEEDSVRLFFSVGRSRKVFPREILGLIISKVQTAKEDIGVIRILDNYSFVQVRKTAADDIINTLNGMVFRGRPLLVNYARAKKDTEDEGEDRGIGEGDLESPASTEAPGGGDEISHGPAYESTLNIEDDKGNTDGV